MLRMSNGARYVAFSLVIFIVSGTLMTTDWVISSLTGINEASLGDHLYAWMIGAISAAIVADLLVWFAARASGGSSVLYFLFAVSMQLAVLVGTWSSTAAGELVPGSEQLPALAWLNLIIVSPLVLMRSASLRRMMRPQLDYRR